MSIPILYPLSLAAFIFAVGLYGALTKTNAIRILMSVELMLNGVNINLITFSRYITPNNYRGQILTIFVMTVAAAEAAVGLALILVLGRNRNVVDIDKITLLKG